MGGRIVFTGPAGDYVITLPDAVREEERLLVRSVDGEAEWVIETVAADADGLISLSGMTPGQRALWFELCVGERPEMRYWGDRVVVRTDTGHHE